MKKLISCLLVIIICIGLFSACGEDSSVPDGMYSATLEGEPFVLYVPEGWIDNRDSGISSAYYSLENAVTVSARSYAATVTEGETFLLDAYIDTCVAEYNEKYNSFQLVDRKESALGSTPATRVECTFVRSATSYGVTAEESMTAVQYYALHGENVVILSIYCKTSAAQNEDYLTMFEQIRGEFVLCEPNAVNHVVTDKDTPEGMKRISPDGAQYRFYAPLSWVSNMSDKMTDAYYPEGGRPNISVTAFSPDTVMTPSEYFEQCQEIYKKDVPGYEANETIEAQNRQVAGRAAISYIYTAGYGGAEYKIMQTILEYNDLIYSVTYTAYADRFDAHMADVELMLANFYFR